MLIPLPTAPDNVPVPPETVYLMDAFDSSPVMSAQIKQWTAKDPVLSKITDLVRHGGPRDKAAISSYHKNWKEISVQDGCLLHGNHVFGPAEGMQACNDGAVA